MEKLANKNEKFFVKFLLFFLVWIIGIILLLFLVPSILIRGYYIPFVVICSGLVVYFLFFKLVYNDIPKYIDGKYIWKDGRIYEGDWDKKHGANGKGKLIWADGSFYEGEFRNGYLSGKGKKVCPSGESYEGGFKNGKPDGMGVIRMNNGYYYEGEFSDGKRTGRFKKQVLTTGGIIEGKFRDNGNDGYDGIGKVTTSNGFVFEGIFQNGKLNGEGKLTTPDGEVLVGIFDNGEFKKGKQILKNGEYVGGNWVNGRLTGMAKYYFKDGSYYEGECGDTGWQGIGMYVTKRGKRYSTEFPYKIVDVLLYGLNSRLKEIQGSLNYVPKSEKEKNEEKDMYLKILKKGTSLQKEIAGLFLEEEESAEKYLNSLKSDGSVGNIFKFHKNMLKLYEESKKYIKKIADKNHIKYSKSVSSYSYGKYFYVLDCCYDVSIEVFELFIKIDKFLNSENVLSFIIRKEEKDKERVILIDNFSDKYNEYIQRCLDWREYEKKFRKHNFKSDNKGK